MLSIIPPSRSASGKYILLHWLHKLPHCVGTTCNLIQLQVLLLVKYWNTATVAFDTIWIQHCYHATGVPEDKACMWVYPFLWKELVTCFSSSTRGRFTPDDERAWPLYISILRTALLRLCAPALDGGTENSDTAPCGWPCGTQRC